MRIPAAAGESMPSIVSSCSAGLGQQLATPVLDLAKVRGNSTAEEGFSTGRVLSFTLQMDVSNS
jgi:hypothetical protein